MAIIERWERSEDTKRENTHTHTHTKKKIRRYCMAYCNTYLASAMFEANRNPSRRLPLGQGYMLQDTSIPCSSSTAIQELAQSLARLATLGFPEYQSTRLLLTWRVEGAAVALDIRPALVGCIARASPFFPSSSVFSFVDPVPSLPGPPPFPSSPHLFSSPSRDRS